VYRQLVAFRHVSRACSIRPITYGGAGSGVNMISGPQPNYHRMDSTQFLPGLNSGVGVEMPGENAEKQPHNSLRRFPGESRVEQG
jgi:hypothetical protein